jgi:type II secretory pathway component PulM
VKALWTRLRRAFDELAPRERVLVSIVGVLLVLSLAWLGVASPILAAADRIEQRADQAEQQLEVVQRLRREFEEVNQRLASVEQRIGTSRGGNLRTTLETLATAASVKIESMEPQSSPANETYRETKVEVSLKQVTLPQTVRYLHEIESTPEALSVKALRMRSRADKPEFLDVTFTVSSFEPL